MIDNVINYFYITLLCCSLFMSFLIASSLQGNLHICVFDQLWRQWFFFILLHWFIYKWKMIRKCVSKMFSITDTIEEILYSQSTKSNLLHNSTIGLAWWIKLEIRTQIRRANTLFEISCTAIILWELTIDSLSASHVSLYCYSY